LLKRLLPPEEAIGQDFIKLFSELTINFDDMYIKGADLPDVEIII